MEHQIAKDVSQQSRDIELKVEWHFFPSETSRRIADDTKLLDALIEAGIPYVIHLP